MTSRSATCFKVSILLCLLAPVVAAATITGIVELTGTVSGTDASGVVVMLEPLGDNSLSAKVLPQHGRILQKQKTFLPHVLAVPVGSTVDFPNLDPIFHNAFSNFNGQIFDIGLYPPGKNRSVVFRRAGVVRVFCNIHPAMSALIVVVNTPYFALTDRSGKFTISGVPPGAYRRAVFYERATPEVLATEAKDIELPPTRLSEAGYIPMPHLNKYGKSYPRGSGEDTLYGVP